MRRDFIITASPKNGGEACPQSYHMLCNSQPCVVDCELSEWIAEPAGCSASCGGGVLTEVRSIKQAALFGGRCADQSSPDRLRELPCNIHPCPIDCDLSSWKTDDAGCSKFCGNGTARQTRSLEREAAHGGTCPDPASEHRERWIACNMQPCTAVAVVQDVLKGSALAVASLQDFDVAIKELGARGEVLVRHYPRFNCSAGITADMRESVAVCVKNSMLTDSAMDIKMQVNNASKQCALLSRKFRLLMAEMKRSLPFLVWRVCENDLPGANSTFAILLKHVDVLVHHLTVCDHAVQEQSFFGLQEQSGYDLRCVTKDLRNEKVQ